MLSLLHFNLRICFRTKIPRQSRTPTVIKNGFSVYEKRDGLHAMDKHSKAWWKDYCHSFFFFERKIETFLNFFGLITYYKLHTSQKRIIWLTCTHGSRISQKMMRHYRSDLHPLKSFTLHILYVTLQNQCAFYITSRKLFYGFSKFSAYLLTCIESQIAVRLFNKFSQ